MLTSVVGFFLYDCCVCVCHSVCVCVTHFVVGRFFIDIPIRQLSKEVHYIIPPVYSMNPFDFFPVGDLRLGQSISFMLFLCQNKQELLLTMSNRLWSLCLHHFSNSRACQKFEHFTHQSCCLRFRFFGLHCSFVRSHSSEHPPSNRPDQPIHEGVFD